MDYDKRHLGTMDDIRRVSRDRPAVTLEAIDRILQKHGLGRAEDVEALGPTPYVTNFVHKIHRPQASPVVLKGQHLPTATWDVAVEVEALRLLRDGTSLPVPPWATYDGDRDILEHPFALIAWLDGRSSLEVYEASTPQQRLVLARQHGAIHRAIHDCPLPVDHALPRVDLREWRQLTPGLLFAGDEFHDALTRLCPAYEEAVRRRLDDGPPLEPISPPVLTWRDGSLANTVANEANGQPRICGVFDVQSAIVMQRHWDLVKAFNAFVPGREPARTPTEEWKAFCEGYGEDIRLDGPEKKAFSIVFPALYARHWWEATGVLHPQTPSWLDDLLEGLAQAVT